MFVFIVSMMSIIIRIFKYKAIFTQVQLFILDTKQETDKTAF